MFSVAEDCVLCSLPLQQLQLSAEALGRSFLSSLMGSGNSLYSSTSVSWAGREAVTAGPGWLHVLRCRGAGPTVEGSGRRGLKSTTLVTSALGWGDCWGQLEAVWNRLGWRGGGGSYFTEKFIHDVGKGRGKVRRWNER